MKTAKAFSPAGISSFFEICDTTKDGNGITDPERIGSRGGGFVIEKGVHTQVEVNEAEKEGLVEAWKNQYLRKAIKEE